LKWEVVVFSGAEDEEEVEGRCSPWPGIDGDGEPAMKVCGGPSGSVCPKQGGAVRGIDCRVEARRWTSRAARSREQLAARLCVAELQGAGRLPFIGMSRTPWFATHSR
jgi:hypothetical protein